MRTLPCACEQRLRHGEAVLTRPQQLQAQGSRQHYADEPITTTCTSKPGDDDTNGATSPPALGQSPGGQIVDGNGLIASEPADRRGTIAGD
jgi:hypothetical protein